MQLLAGPIQSKLKYSYFGDRKLFLFYFLGRAGGRKCQTQCFYSKHFLLSLVKLSRITWFRTYDSLTLGLFYRKHLVTGGPAVKHIAKCRYGTVHILGLNVASDLYSDDPSLGPNRPIAQLRFTCTHIGSFLFLQIFRESCTRWLARTRLLLFESSIVLAVN